MDNQTDLQQYLIPPKGTRDFSPKQAALRLKVRKIIREQFELFGFGPLETPAFENMAVLEAKFAGGAEILKETYSFVDTGNRKLGLRYDLTVPLCRYVASDSSIARPFKRYSIGSVYRDGPLKTGRYREFVQCDADIVGCNQMSADGELLALACRIFNKLGLQIEIKLNNRKLLFALMEEVGILEKREQLDGLLIIDKLEKIGWQQVEEQWIGKGLAKLSLDKIKTILTLPENNLQILSEMSAKIPGEKGKQAIEELNEVIEWARAFGCTTTIRLDPSLSRGLDYYTGSIFEITLKDCEKYLITSSLSAGGRYDDLIGKFAGKNEEERDKNNDYTYNAVGISFGLDVIMDCLQATESKILQEDKPDVFVFTIKLEKEAARIADELRKNGIKTQIDLTSRGVSKNLEYAAKSNFRFAIIIGPSEQKQGKVKLRNLSTGNEELFETSEAIKQIKSELNQIV